MQKNTLIFIPIKYTALYFHQYLTEKNIYCFYKVYNSSGYGFLEKAYENAMMTELRKWIECFKTKVSYSLL